MENIKQLKEEANKVASYSRKAMQAWYYAEYNMTNPLDPNNLASCYWYKECIREGKDAKLDDELSQEFPVEVRTDPPWIDDEVPEEQRRIAEQNTENLRQRLVWKSLKEIKL